ncbi:MAG: 23S rRNA pseudouridine(1911/1915/1917) synthase RluD [Burkholderiales bacterium]|jgi:23S rRNA pseudouridine1911/1915/1917 synthase|nr:23S rRNA pseudouridine(1911/1915/1917) synthase RluD [Nitrosomonadaceae bacterium]
MQSSEYEDEDYSPVHPLDPSASVPVENIVMPFSLAGERLDAALAQLFPQHSRSRIAALIKAGDIQVNGGNAEPKQRVTGSERVAITFAPRAEDTAFSAEPVPLDVVFEDDDVIVINKPPGLVVHPAVGNWSGTVLNGVLYRYPQTAHVPRAGIVHRLDKDTSGLMMVALTEAAQLNLVRQLQARSVSRQYLALLRGLLDEDGTVDAPIGRHPRDRVRMAVVQNGAHGKPAVTHYRVLEQFRYHTLVECRLETGRTHQIRVHMASLGVPLEGDALYGKGLKGLVPSLQPVVSAFARQALHAQSLAFDHPATNQRVSFQSDIPEDMQSLIDAVSHV